MRNDGKPHNPGMSEKAWDNLHALIAEFQIKYGPELAKKEREMNDATSNQSA